MGETIAELEAKLAAVKSELVKARRALPAAVVGEYVLRDGEGRAIEFASLFGDQNDLIVIHNMGRSCVYCTAFADGLNGVAEHVRDRAPLVLASPDEPETMRRFAEGRGWKFRLVSTRGTAFGRDMGFEGEGGQPMPGVSGFHRQPDGKVVRTGRAQFGPGDEFCPVWHLFDLLRDGTNGWEPKYSYPAR